MIVDAAIKDETGKVWTGRRHCYIIQDMVLKGVQPPITGEQGFVDEAGIFFDRTAAAALALREHQIERLRWPPLLYTEDLW